MTVQFDLVKATETLQFSLVKHDVQEIKPCQVSFICDVSGSFDDEHREGYTQALLNRLVPFSLVFDKNKTLDSFVFSSQAEQLADINAGNYSDYVRRHIQRSNVYGRATSYAAAFEEVIRNLGTKTQTRTVQAPASGFMSRLFGKTQTVTETVEVPQEDKYIHFFVTDGESSNEGRDLEAINRLLASNGNHFIVFLAVNDGRLPFLERNFASQRQTSYIHLTKRELMNLQNLSDEQIYEILLTDNFTAWMNN